MAVLVEYHYTDATVAGRDEHRATHRAWLQQQIDAGLVHVSGPYPDGSGALIIATGDDIDAAKELLESDPFQREGLVESTRYVAWQPVLGAKF